MKSLEIHCSPFLGLQRQLLQADSQAGRDVDFLCPPLFLPAFLPPPPHLRGVLSISHLCHAPVGQEMAGLCRWPAYSSCVILAALPEF